LEGEDKPPRRQTLANPGKETHVAATQSATVARKQTGSRFSDSDSESFQSRSEVEENPRKKFLKDKTKNEKPKSTKGKGRRAVGEPTIAERMHSVKEHLDEIEISSAAQLTASGVIIKEWLKDLELIRSKTANSMQGSLNGKMRERLGVLHRVLDTLAIRAEEKRDLAYLKIRNTKLQAQLLASQRETKRLHRRLDEMQLTINELRSLMGAGERAPRENKATSPTEATTRERSISQE